MTYYCRIGHSTRHHLDLLELEALAGRLTSASVPQMLPKTMSDEMSRKQESPPHSLISEPPEGDLSFVLPLTPVSQQGSAQRKAEQRFAVQKVLGQYGFILTGDVHVEIDWLVSERVRYE